MRQILAFAAAVISLPTALAAQGLCESPSAACGALLEQRCLQPLGAGVMSVETAGEGTDAPAPGGCPGQLDAYKQCLGRVLDECGGAPALDLTALPSVSGLMLQSCLTPQTVQMVCGGIEHKLTVTLSSGDLHGTGGFAGYGGQLFALGPDGAAEPVASLDGKINEFAPYVQNIELGVSAPAEVFGACITFTPPEGDTEWGMVQALRMQGMVPAAMAQMMGGGQSMGQPVSPRVAFPTAKSNCAAEMRKLSKQYVK